MSTEKTFTVVGTSITREGVLKLRWANDMSRVKILIKAGHTEIDLIDLPNPMTKLQAAQYLLTTSLSPEREAVATLKVTEKVKVKKSVTLTNKTKGAVSKTKKPTDPKVEKFIQTAKSEENV